MLGSPSYFTRTNEFGGVIEHLLTNLGTNQSKMVAPPGFLMKLSLGVLAAIAEMNSSGDWATHFDMLLHFIFQTNKTYHSEDEHNKTCEFYVLSGLEEKKKNRCWVMTDLFKGKRTNVATSILKPVICEAWGRL